MQSLLSIFNFLKNQKLNVICPEYENLEKELDTDDEDTDVSSDADNLSNENR